jgi:hypothetical protein
MCNRKIPWRLSKFQKARQRKRLRAVDNLVSVVDKALSKQGVTTKAVERWKTEMPIEQEMMPRDKYTMFDRKEKKYRKGIHSKYIKMAGSFNIFRILTELQSYQNGQEFRNELTLPVTDMYGFEILRNVLYV